MAAVPVPIKKPAPSIAANLQQVLQGKLNPFALNDEQISANIIGTHDSKAVRYDVDHLYNIVSDIVKHANAPQLGEHLDLKRASTVQFVEERVPDGSFMPTFCTLKEISAEISCKPFNAYTAHERIMWILDRLRGYNWDAKGVTVLAAFALDYGDFWHISKMFPTKANSIEVHTFRLVHDRPTVAKMNYNTLVDPAMQLIKGVIELEKLFNKAYSTSRYDFTELYTAPRDIYTYWAIFALLACAGQVDQDLISELGRRLAIELSHFTALSKTLKARIGAYEDYLWRLGVFQTPSGILQLLIALIFPRDIPYPEIYDNTTKTLVSPEELRTKYLLLFISGLDHIDDEIWDLNPIHNSFMSDPRKSNYRILWVPVVDDWTDERRRKFERLKSEMRWYIVEYFQLIKGYRVLKELWEYQEKPIVVVVDPRGNVLHKNALPMITVWGDGDPSAFPFTYQREEELSEHWRWFWRLAMEVHAPLVEWLRKDRYIFVYGGMDEARAGKFGEFVERIKRDEILQPQRGGVEADIEIEHVNLKETLKSPEISSKFWGNITNTFQSRILNSKIDQYDNVLFDIEMLLAMNNQRAWALFSKGPHVLAVDYDPVIYETLEEFGNWRRDIHLKQGFDKAFSDYYHMKRSQELRRKCYEFQLRNLRSAVPHNVYCPEPGCRLKMEIESVNYRCCHERPDQALVERPPERDEGHVAVMKNL